MLLKANLHFHTSDDPEDRIAYTTREGIDRAAALGFRILALTCHRIVAWTPAYDAYAAERGILLIPGIEQTIEGTHVVLLNADRAAERIETFADLAAYRRTRSGCFVLAPHPFFGGGQSLGKKLERYIDLFDAVECSWFFSKRVDRNRPAERLALRHGLPFLATSDTHVLRYLDASYAEIDAADQSVDAVIAALRARRFTNVAHPLPFWRTMVFDVGMHIVASRIERLVFPSHKKRCPR